MTATVARLILALAVILATLIMFFYVSVILANSLADAVALLASVSFCAAFFAVAWLLVWRGAIRWTRERMVQTAASFPAAIIAAAIVYFVSAWAIAEVGIVVAGLAWATTWLASTALIWCENGSERRDRLARLDISVIACPTCGYNLTGLHEARCPECGSQFTLDQLYAAVAQGKSDLGEQ